MSAGVTDWCLTESCVPRAVFVAENGDMYTCVERSKLHIVLHWRRGDDASGILTYDIRKGPVAVISQVITSMSSLMWIQTQNDTTIPRLGLSRSRVLRPRHGSAPKRNVAEPDEGNGDAGEWYVRIYVADSGVDVAVEPFVQPAIPKPGPVTVLWGPPPALWSWNDGSERGTPP